MKNYNLWSGLSMGCLSLWYHIAGFCAGILIDTDNIVAFNVWMGEAEKEVTLTAEDIKQAFGALVWVNFGMCASLVLAHICIFLGRYTGKKNGTTHDLNLWFFAAKLIETLSTLVWVVFVLITNFICLDMQMCLYKSNGTPQGTQCMEHFSEPIVFILYGLNSYFAYNFGIVTYMAARMIVSSIRNRKVTCAQKQFMDILMLRQKDAKWAGYQFMMLYLNIMAIVWGKVYTDHTLGKSDSFYKDQLPLLVMLATNIVRTAAYQPLSKINLPEEYKPKRAPDQSEVITAINRGEESDLELVKEANAWRPDENIEKEDDVLYAVMEYSLRTKLWFLWPLILIGDIGTITYWLVHGQKSDENVFLRVYVLLNGWASIWMGICWFKQFAVFKWQQKHPGTETEELERKVVDVTLLEYTPVQLTKKVREKYAKAEIGNNLYTQVFKMYHIQTQKKMHYSLQTIMQNTYMVLFAMLIQLILATIMIAQQANPENADVSEPDNFTGLLARFALSCVMHAQTEQYVRFGLQMMKYAINHPQDFSNPVIATQLGFLYAINTMLLTIACIIKMCTEFTILDVLNSYISYGIIVFLPNFAYASLPVGHVLKAPAPDLMIKKHRRFIKERTCGNWFMRIVFKSLRIVYASFWYYFLPLLAVILPFVQKFIYG